MKNKPIGINAKINKIAVRILKLTIVFLSLFLNPEIKKTKLIPQSVTPRRIENGVNMLNPFNGEMIERKTIVIIKIAIIAVVIASLICFICI
jgi:hypothetical protein